VDDSAGDPNGAPDPAQPPAQNPAPAQKPPSKHDLKEPPTPEHTGIRALFGNLIEDFKHLPTATNGIIASGGGVAALAVHPLGPEGQHIHGRPLRTQFNTFFAPGKYIGDTPEQIAGAIVHMRVRAVARPAWSRTSEWIAALQAQILGEILFNPIKLRHSASVGRQRQPVVPVRPRDDHVRDRDCDRAPPGLAKALCSHTASPRMPPRRAFTTTSAG
jgi:hypothetical protein